MFSKIKQFLKQQHDCGGYTKKSTSKKWLITVTTATTVRKQRRAPLRRALSEYLFKLVIAAITLAVQWCTKKKCSGQLVLDYIEISDQVILVSIKECVSKCRQLITLKKGCGLAPLAACTLPKLRSVVQCTDIKHVVPAFASGLMTEWGNLIKKATVRVTDYKTYTWNSKGPQYVLKKKKSWFSWPFCETSLSFFFYSLRYILYLFNELHSTAIKPLANVGAVSSK